jgi:hypothetical protein
VLQSFILIAALLLGGRRREGKKKRERNSQGFFPRTRPALLAVLQVAAVRCN